MTGHDTRLMLLAADDDEAAFAELLNRNLGRVHGVIRRYLGRTADADDLAQEVFIRVYRSRARYAPSARFTTWLYRITANLCMNYIRDRKRKPALSLDANPDIPTDLRDDEARAPDDLLLEEERALAVRAAVDQLPDSQRMAVILYRFEGLSYRALGEVLELSVPAVKSLLFRARENLKEALRSLA